MKGIGCGTRSFRSEFSPMRLNLPLSAPIPAAGNVKGLLGLLGCFLPGGGTKKAAVQAEADAKQE